MAKNPTNKTTDTVAPATLSTEKVTQFPGTEPQVNSNQIQGADLASVIKIIDVVSRRGAFEGAELSEVGALRTRILTVLNSLQQAAEPTSPETPSPAA